jgi:hypothetical protein
VNAPALCYVMRVLWCHLPHVAWPVDENGAHDRTRTGDLLLTKEVLYHLSYMGASILLTRQRSNRKRFFHPVMRQVERATRFELATLSLEG